MRIAGIDPGMSSGAIVIIDAPPGRLPSLLLTRDLGPVTEKATCVAAKAHLLAVEVGGILIATQPQWVAIETNVMMGAAGRANGDVPLLGRGAILAGMGHALANGCDFGWKSANPSKWRKDLGGSAKSLGGVKGKPKRLDPERLAFLGQALLGAERLTTDHEQDAAFLALWLASQVEAAEAGLASVLEVVK